ncbi:MAG TPA: prepilin-type N-terminal cleavage/methylation domain-containing protein [Patescibacteria group bacterium]|nr:prepilin-type N-terminal cleavage/methylation domain-containing protein [Patescibacteria group bacterium]
MKQRSNEIMKQENKNETGVFLCFRVSLFPCSNDKGFTLIELLIVIGIFLVLAVFVLPVHGNLQVSTQLNENSSLIIQTLRIAQERSSSGLNNTNHGVYFRINARGAEDKFVLYQGGSYGNREKEYDRKYFLDEVLSFSLPGASSEYDLNFSKGEGIPDNPGTITLSHSAGGEREIIINEIGMVEKN